MVPCRLRVPRQCQVPAVGGRQMDVDHLQSGQLLQDGRGVSPGAHGDARFFKVTVQAVAHEGDEDVRLDALLALMEHRPDGEIVLEFLERLFDLESCILLAPQRRWILAGQVGAQQLAALAAAGPAPPVAVQREREGVRGHRHAGLSQVDVDQVPGAPREAAEH